MQRQPIFVIPFTYILPPVKKSVLRIFTVQSEWFKLWYHAKCPKWAMVVFKFLRFFALLPKL